MRRLIDSFSEYERALIASRTRLALAAKRRKGQRVSGIMPFGFRLASDGTTLEHETAEQSAVETIRALRAAGASLRGIADTLNARGRLTRAGTPGGLNMSEIYFGRRRSRI